MSKFSGILDEYSFISIDNFIPLVSAYFISHLHLDHIGGVDKFIPLNGVIIYTSVTTAQLIRGRYSDLKAIIPFVRDLEIGVRHIITVKRLLASIDETLSDITVTLIPTGHCLGSVMFLIDGNRGPVLYTGDFRIPVGGFNAIKSAHKIGHLKAIYLDTTFFKRSCLYFPSMERSVLTMLDIIEKFLLESPQNVVHISITTRYTLEILYHMIYMRLNIKVHIQWEYYAQLSELDPCFTSSMDHLNFDSRVHACYLDNNDAMSGICRRKFEVAKSKNQFLKIQPSALWWSDKGMGNGNFVHRVDRHTVRVCFASHSSYTEIIDLLLTLPCDSIRDCVSQSDLHLNTIIKHLRSMQSRSMDVII